MAKRSSNTTAPAESPAIETVEGESIDNQEIKQPSITTRSIDFPVLCQEQTPSNTVFHFDFKLHRRRDTARALTRIHHGLIRSGATLKNGKHITSINSALVWIAEQLEESINKQPE